MRGERRSDRLATTAALSRPRGGALGCRRATRAVSSEVAKAAVFLASDNSSFVTGVEGKKRKRPQNGHAAQRSPVDAAEAVRRAGHAPIHALVGEVGEGVSERRQLPVEHGEEARRIGVENHVVDPPVAVHQRDSTVVDGDIPAEPVDEPLHVVDRCGFARAILLGPALQLPGEVAAGLSVVGKSGRSHVDGVEPDDNSISYKIVEGKYSYPTAMEP